MDPRYAGLTDGVKLVYLGLTTLASELNNKVPKDKRYIRKRLGISTFPDFEALLKARLIEPWTEPKMLATCQQGDLLEIQKHRSTEAQNTEAQSIEENNTPASMPAAGIGVKETHYVPEKFWPSEDDIKWARDRRPDVNNFALKDETEKFKDHRFKTPHKDWGRAWRNWIRRTWPVDDGTGDDGTNGPHGPGDKNSNGRNPYSGPEFIPDEFKK
jgi:hypothetical protein